MKRSIWIILGVCILLVASTLACTFTDRVKSIFQRQATLVPTITPRPTVSTIPLVIPKTANTEFEGELSETDIEGYIKEEMGQDAAQYVKELHVRITPEALFADVQVAASTLNLTFGVTIAGVPNLVDEKLYLKVTQITVDEKLTGWTRLSAKTLIQSIIDKYSTENGIPIDIANVKIDKVELREGKIYVHGTTT